jgi:hypothetical protein
MRHRIISLLIRVLHFEVAAVVGVLLREEDAEHTVETSLRPNAAVSNSVHVIRLK